MKKLIALLLVLALAAGLGAFLILHEGVTPRFLVEYRAREEQNIPEAWPCVSQSCRSGEVLLFYDPDNPPRHIFSLYEKRTGGFAFTRGGSVPMIESGIYRIALPQDNACAYLSINTPGAALVTFPGQEDTPLDPQKPFVVILPAPAERTAFFTADGTPITVNIQGNSAGS